MKCFMCKGILEDKKTNFILDLEECIIIIKNVPSQVCSQCGEVSYSDDVARKLEIIISQVKNIVKDVAVFEYSKMVA